MSSSTLKPLDLFEYKEFTPLAEGVDPDYHSLSLLQKQANANAAAIESTGGDGKHGLLAITIGATEYKTLTNADWTDPTQPPAEATIPTNATATDVALVTRQHDRRVQEWNTFNNTMKELRSLLLKAIPRAFIAELADDTCDFTNITPFEILSHLWQTYGQITDDMKTDNLNELDKQWNSTEPITSLWTQVQKCQKFAEKAKEKIPETVIKRSIINNLKATGEFELDVRDWEKETDQSLANMKRYFTKANTKRVSKKTAASEGYAGKATDSSTNATPNTNNGSSGTMHYCWTHGYNTTHAGSACQYKQEGHKDEATVHHMMGGNNRVQRKRNERAVFKERDRTQKGKKKAKKTDTEEEKNDTEPSTDE